MGCSNGLVWTRNGLEWRSGAVACSLSSTLETGSIASRFFLSGKACAGILRRAEARGKKLPEALRLALEAATRECEPGGGGNTSGSIDVAPALLAQPGWKGDFDSETFATQSPIAFHPTQDPISSTDGTTHAMGCGSSGGTASIAVACVTGDIAHALNTANNGKGCSEDGTGRGVPTIAFASATEFMPQSSRVHGEHESAPALQAAGQRMGNRAPQIMQAWKVRRLTPVEAERLQGFPDNWTRIPNWSGWRAMDASETPEQCRAEGLEVRQNPKTKAWRVKDVDGPRYRAIGNSWAVPVAAWIGKRLDEALRRAQQDVKRAA